MPNDNFITNMQIEMTIYCFSNMISVIFKLRNIIIVKGLIMLDNCLYDKIKILHHVSCILWFIEKHAKEDAKKTNDTECLKILEELEKDLEKHVKNLKKIVCQDCK